jgi:hypothetical protein
MTNTTDCVVKVFRELTGESEETARVRFETYLTGAAGISEAALSACLTEAGWMMTKCDAALCYSHADNSVDPARFETFWKAFQGEGVIFYTVEGTEVGHAVVVRSGGIVFDLCSAPETEFIVDYFKRFQNATITSVCLAEKMLTIETNEAARGPATANAENAPEAWRDREFAEKLVENLRQNDRITVDRPGDPETTYTLYRPSAEPELMFKSGDRAAVRQAIASGLLEPTSDATYKKRETVQNPGPD